MTAEQIVLYDQYVELVNLATAADGEAADFLALSQMKTAEARAYRAQAKLTAESLGITVAW